MADRDFPLVSGRKRPTYRADNRQTAPKGTKQNSLNSLWKREQTQSCQTNARYNINDQKDVSNSKNLSVLKLHMTDKQYSFSLT